jgi:hypothetical protein
MVAASEIHAFAVTIAGVGMLAAYGPRVHVITRLPEWARDRFARSALLNIGYRIKRRRPEWVSPRASRETSELVAGDHRDISGEGHAEPHIENAHG